MKTSRRELYLGVDSVSIFKNNFLLLKEDEMHTILPALFYYYCVMPYGKTKPVEYICPETGKKMYGRRANKVMEKKSIKKYCPKLRRRVEMKPKEAKHSS